MLSSIHQVAIAAVVVGSPWLVMPCVSFQVSDAVRTDWWDEHAQPVDFAVQVVREMKHAGKPWTEGLEFTEEGDALIETSGSFPPGTPSFVRMLDAQTGRELSRTSAGLNNASVGRGRFVEGVTQLGSGPESHWFASTYTDNVVVEYDQDFNEVAEHHFPFEGWGLVRNADSTAFFATNGTAHVMELAPGSFEVLGVKTARCYGKDVPEINELELVQNFMGHGRPALLGNVLGTRLVIVLNPSSMQCIGAFHLDSLGPVETGEKFGLHVANGIAFSRQTGNFVVTGKNWDRMFEIRLAEELSEDGGGQALGLLATHLGVDAGRGAGSSALQVPHAVRDMRRRVLRASNRK